MNPIIKAVGENYIAIRELADGRVIGIHRLIGHWSLHVDVDFFGYADSFCYMKLADITQDFETWDGQGDPPGPWHRNPRTGRRRDPATGEEWVTP